VEHWIGYSNERKQITVSVYNSYDSTKLEYFLSIVIVKVNSAVYFLSESDAIPRDF
jgi:hypothetical protein